ncbi:hypothetical protein CEXT_543551 [Caerostris extrusa]|uniref:Uncharacterized protein n=1 Tax=Caerostris extrusa TaxID=172846 RepID=A0AAV4NTB0_CAEEX|nr:hypothetical protein CEXT_543551 [Caerostris extrusa]
MQKGMCEPEFSTNQNKLPNDDQFGKFETIQKGMSAPEFRSNQNKPPNDDQFGKFGNKFSEFSGDVSEAPINALK